jgi:hypothetical protein
VSIKHLESLQKLGELLLKKGRIGESRIVELEENNHDLLKRNEMY